MRVLGILLVIFGVILLVYQGLTLIVPQGTMDTGVFSITVREGLVIPMPPILGIISLICGVVFIMSAPPREVY